jgi:hypothetical protein
MNYYNFNKSTNKFILGKVSLIDINLITSIFNQNSINFQLTTQICVRYYMYINLAFILLYKRKLTFNFFALKRDLLLTKHWLIIAIFFST